MNRNIEKLIKRYYDNREFIKDPTGYFYDLDAVKKNIKNIENNMPSNVSLYYAMKANSNDLIMDTITNDDYIKGIEIASYGELECAKNYIKSKCVIFTGPGKTEYELEMAIKNRIRLINVESLTEAYRIQNIAQKLNVDKVDILLRINLDYAVYDGVEMMAGKSTKLGIDEKYYGDVFNEIKKLDRINVKGIHTFIASGVIDYKKLIKSNVYIFDFVKHIEKNYGHIDIIDFGGGLGIDYSEDGKIFDIVNYGICLYKLINDYKFNDKEFIMELGTYLVGNCGYYTSKIIDIKENKNYKHIILAGGINHMGLPLEIHRKHPLEIINMHEKKLYKSQISVKNEKADISGPICMSNDKLWWDGVIDNANIGDIVVFKQSGAYCFGEGMHEFLKHFKPKEITFSKKDFKD